MYYLYRGIRFDDEKCTAVRCIAVAETMDEIKQYISEDLNEQDSKNHFKENLTWKDWTNMTLLDFRYDYGEDQRGSVLYKIINENNDSQFITFSFLDSSIGTYGKICPIFDMDDMFIYYIDDNRFQFIPTYKKFSKQHRICKVPRIYEHLPLYDHKKLKSTSPLEYYDIGKNMRPEPYFINHTHLDKLTYTELSLIKSQEEELLKKITYCLEPLLKSREQIESTIKEVEKAMLKSNKLE